MAAGLIAAGLLAGTLSDRSVPPEQREMGGYQVLVGDFHVHSFPGSWGLLAPWDEVIEARRQGFDVIAMTPHNHVWVAKLGRWFAEATGGPIVIVGEEIAHADYHLIGVGIEHTIQPAPRAADAVDAVHRQGGVAIAAHPYAGFWEAWDAEAREKLDGAEVVRPDAQAIEALAEDLRRFYASAPLTAIGSSDWRGLSRLGNTRTYVFARERSEEGVLEALREGRTIVYDRGRPYGDPALIGLVEQNGGLPSDVPVMPEPGAARLFSRLAAVLGLLAFVLLNKMGSADGSVVGSGVIRLASHSE